MEPFEKKIQDYTETVQERCVRESAVMETVRKSTDAFVLQDKQEEREHNALQDPPALLDIMELLV